MKKKCPHGRRRNLCKECGGGGICPHGRRRYQCKKCGGAGICPHNRVRNTCKECGGSSVCPHGRRRCKCKECGGGGICHHGRQRYACSICRPAGAYKTYVRHEKENGTPLPYNFMTLETFVSLVSQSCHWCGRTPERANGMGVDRKDNSLGHVEGNLHPCCSLCNYSRRHAGSEEWGDWVLDMAAFHNQ